MIMKNTDVIAEFLKVMQDVKKDYDFAVMSVGIEDKTCQDLLHAIEFSKNKNERNRLATQLKRSRNERREYKNKAEALEPLVKYMEQHKSAIETLKYVLGQVRKIENAQVNREYFPRVLKKGEKNGGQSVAPPEQNCRLQSLASENGLDIGETEGRLGGIKGSKARQEKTIDNLLKR